MPLPPHHLCFIKIPNGLPFQFRLIQVKEAIKWMSLTAMSSTQCQVQRYRGKEMCSGCDTWEEPLQPLQVSSEHMLQLQLVFFQLNWSQQQMTQRSIHVHSRKNVAWPTMARIVHPITILYDMMFRVRNAKCINKSWWVVVLLLLHLVIFYCCV